MQATHFSENKTASKYLLYEFENSGLKNCTLDGYKFALTHSLKKA